MKLFILFIALSFSHLTLAQSPHQQHINQTQRLAEQGDAKAQFNLGVMLETGTIVPKNNKLAFNWFLKAALQGYAKAQSKVGYIYYTFKTYTKAWEWLQKAAKQGDAKAQYQLGVMLKAGEGVQRNHNQALLWFQRAARQGSTEAQYRLGDMYYYGEKGLPRNYKLALKWWKKAAHQGHAKAQYFLGGMYYYGHGVDQNYELALEWLQKADQQGHPNAKKLYQDVKRKMHDDPKNPNPYSN